MSGDCLQCDEMRGPVGNEYCDECLQELEHDNIDEDES